MAELKAKSDGSGILAYYERYDEASRLERSVGLLEYARMRELIQRFLPSPPRVILDVGGGPGRYSCWLSELGYEVHLIDPVEKHVRQAREASGSQRDKPLASVTRGDARALNHGEGGVDTVLLMGPLYHLTDRDQRLTALREARRVLKPGGLLIAKAINRFAALVDGFREGFIDDPKYVPILSRGLDDGQHRGDGHEYFTTAFLHRPEEFEAEILEAGFDCGGLYAVQGPGEFANDLEGRMSDPRKRVQLLDLVRSVEQETTLLGVSSHFIAVAYRPVISVPETEPTGQALEAV